MSSRSIRGAATLALALLVSGSAVNVARGDTVVTSGARTRDISFFGDPNTEMYGQTFTVGADNILTSFAFDLLHVGAPPPTEFNFFVMRWSGSSATGPVLFTGGPFALSSNSYQTFTFNTGSLALTSGQTYIAFVDTVLNGSGDQAQMAGTANTYTGGEFVYLHGKGNTIAAATSNTWTQDYGILDGDTRFTANFASPAAPVPLPAAATAGFALMGMIAAKRRRPA
jgi:hypothetical protein